MINRILFHINSLGKGGAERVMVNLTETLAMMGKECIIATEWYDEDEYPLDKSVRRIDVGAGDKASELSGSALRRFRREKLHKAILEEKPDVIVAFCRNANYRAILAARNTGVKVIFSVRSDPKTDYASLKQRILSGILYRRAAGAVFQTPDAASFFSGIMKDRSTVILNPLNSKYLNAPRVEKRRNVIVTAGRFHEAKDQLTLLKAFKLISEEYKDINLEMFGSESGDNTYSLLKKYISENGLSERVIFRGNSNSLEKDITDARIFVLSSKYEGMPNALMEAMAMGIPVLSTDCPCGGPAMLIRHGENGLLTAVGDERMMASGLRELLEDPERAERLGENARELCKKAAPLEIASQWISFMEKCTGY